ncbi:MAG: CDP-alcohol phosphatidyltransferase family protein [Candidatus Sulfobium sp.]|jgi:phosphatidylglycerophosphate synthase
MLGEKLGHVFDKPLAGVARKIPFSPNVLTVAGFVVTVIASGVLLADLRTGGVVVLVGGAFDVLDGVVARINGRSSRFGAFLDSVLDRYSDAAILLAIAWNLADRNNYRGAMLCLGTLVGAFLISYTRARAEGLGENCNHGLMERPERVILISFGAIAGLMVPVLWALFVLTHFTVLQRIYHVWRLTGRGPADGR